MTDYTKEYPIICPRCGRMACKHLDCGACARHEDEPCSLINISRRICNCTPKELQHYIVQQQVEIEMLIFKVQRWKEQYYYAILSK